MFWQKRFEIGWKPELIFSTYQAQLNGAIAIPEKFISTLQKKRFSHMPQTKGLRIYKILNFFHWICIVYWGLLLANCRVSHGPKLWLGQKSFNTQQVLTRQESGGSPCNHMLAEKSTSMSTSFAPLVYICCSKDSSYSLWWLAAMGHLKSFPLMWN